MTVGFEIPGKPFGKQRPKFSRQGGFVRAVTPKETVVYENLVRLSYQEQEGRKRFGDDAMIEVAITAYYEIPKSTSKKKRALMLEGKLRPTKKPDADNICKVICDALNGIAYRDDAAIVTATVSKRYSENPHVEVCMWEVKDD